jgi:dUTP pyrophosphatase
VLLLNTDRDAAFAVAPGDRIAQLVIVSLPEVELSESSALSEADRGVRGFGSSG